MFLQSIEMKDRLAFIDLANFLIRIDGVITQDEVDILESYRDEMQVEEITFNSETTLEEIIDNISEDMITRRILVFELLGIAYSDAEYSLEEKTFISNVADLLGLGGIEQFENAVIHLISATQYATDLIMGEE